MRIQLSFYGNLQDLLRRNDAVHQPLYHMLERRASIKDVVESFGIPHPEIGLLKVNGEEVAFEHIVQADEHIEVWPLEPPYDVTEPTILRPESLSRITFAVDVNVGKLAGLLRMAGFDTYYRHALADAMLADIAADEGRILLTRDRMLLKRKNVVFGHLLRAGHPWQQLAEVICLYQLQDKLAPFSRCMRCNALLTPVSKKEVLHRLQPLTIRYYDTFYLCKGCDKVYWPGSHREGMQASLDAMAKSCRVE
jgi:uncharacterized protein with PIN domain